jgi:hypothetical protein
VSRPLSPEPTPAEQQPTTIATRLERRRGYAALHTKPEWGRAEIRELLRQAASAPDLRCQRYAGLLEHAGDGFMVVADSIAALAKLMADKVVGDPRMSAVAMFDLDTDERRVAHTAATVRFITTKPILPSDPPAAPGSDLIMVLSDGDTHTGLSGCRIVRADPQELEHNEHEAIDNGEVILEFSPHSDIDEILATLARGLDCLEEHDAPTGEAALEKASGALKTARAITAGA